MDAHEQAIWKRIGQTIRAIRRSRHMSVDKLAAEVGVVRQQIVRLEAGLGGTTVPRLYAIAEALDVTIQDLLGVTASSQDQTSLLAFRGMGLTEEELEKVLEYIEFLEHRREHKE